MTAEEQLSTVVSADPAKSIRSGLLRRLILLISPHIIHGRLTICLPRGEKITVRGSGERKTQLDEARVDVIRSRAFFRAIAGGAMGLARSYVDGDWETPDLSAVLNLAAINQEDFRRRRGNSPLVNALNRVRYFRHRRRKNSLSGSQRNIAQHYDLGNNFYNLWLDRSMNYSAGLFLGGANDLAMAQEAKCRRLAEALNIRPGMRVLEIGCGWGGFAEMVARDFDCHVTAVTISKAQYEYACERIARNGLSDKVDVRFQDYRDLNGQYDRIASIEMFEAVGEKYWPTFMKKISDCLSRDGLIGLQVITIEEGRYERYRRSADFIQHYIFPGGMLPSEKVLQATLSAADLELKNRFAFGASYAETLFCWRNRFEEAWEEISSLGFDAPFRRVWRYYLAYCEAGFRSGSLDVGQYVIAKTSR